MDSYAFESTYNGALHSTCTPKMTAFANFTDEPTYIKRNKRLGFVADMGNGGVLVTDWTKAMPASTTVWGFWGSYEGGEWPHVVIRASDDDRGYRVTRFGNVQRQ